MRKSRRRARTRMAAPCGSVYLHEMVADSEEIRHLVERLLEGGLGPAEILLQAIEQRRWTEHLRQFLLREFPECSEQEREDCVARHVRRWKERLTAEPACKDAARMCPSRTHQ